MNPELVDFTRRLKVAVPLSAALILLDMGAHVFHLNLLPFLSPEAQQWLKLALAIPAVLWCGWPFFVRGFASIRSGYLNMFTLIALGTGAAFLYSLVATVAPWLFPEAMRDEHGLVPVYYEAAAVIVALVLLGQVLELRARERTGGAIRALARPCAQDRPSRAEGRRDRERAARHRQGRRRLARETGRQGPDRRHGDRGQKRGR